MKKAFIFVAIIAILATAAIFAFNQQNTYRLPSGEKSMYSYSEEKVYILQAGSDGLERLYLEAANPDTFTPLGFNWGKDSHLVFYKEKQVIDADAETFEIIDKQWAKDADSLYYQFIKIPEARQPEFLPITKDGDFLAKVVSNGEEVYLYKPHRLALREALIPVPELSPNTLTFIDKSGFYLKDHDSVIYVYVNSDESPHYEVLNEADAETFVSDFGSAADAKDENFKYRYGQIISE